MNVYLCHFQMAGEDIGSPATKVQVVVNNHVGTWNYQGPLKEQAVSGLNHWDIPLVSRVPSYMCSMLQKTVQDQWMDISEKYC